MTMYLLHPRNHFQVKSEKNDSIFLISILFRITITQRNENETNWKNHWKIYFQNYARIVLIQFSIISNYKFAPYFVISSSRKWF